MINFSKLNNDNSFFISYCFCYDKRPEFPDILAFISTSIFNTGPVKLIIFLIDDDTHFHPKWHIKTISSERQETI